MGRTAEAIDRFTEAVGRDEGLILAHYNLGRAHSNQGNHAVAAEHFRRAADLGPDGDTLFRLGNAHAFAGHMQSAGG